MFFFGISIDISGGSDSKFIATEEVSGVMECPNCGVDSLFLSKTVVVSDELHVHEIDFEYPVCSGCVTVFLERNS